MTEEEIRKKISHASGHLVKMSDEERCMLMDEIRAFMLTLPVSERSKFYWTSGAEIIAMSLPDSYHRAN